MCREKKVCGGVKTINGHHQDSFWLLSASQLRDNERNSIESCDVSRGVLGGCRGEGGLSKVYITNWNDNYTAWLRWWGWRCVKTKKERKSKLTEKDKHKQTCWTGMGVWGVRESVGIENADKMFVSHEVKVHWNILGSLESCCAKVVCVFVSVWQKMNWVSVSLQWNEDEVNKNQGFSDQGNSFLVVLVGFYRGLSMPMF